MCMNFMLFVYVFTKPLQRGYTMEIREAIQQLKQLIETVSDTIEVNEEIIETIISTISQ